MSANHTVQAFNSETDELLIESSAHMLVIGIDKYLSANRDECPKQFATYAEYHLGDRTYDVLIASFNLSSLSHALN